VTNTDLSEFRGGRLSASVIHELNTTLAMISGFAELLELRDDAETRVTAARGIAEGVGRLRALIEAVTGTPLSSPAAEVEVEGGGPPVQPRSG
jgi:signal transduction histidine kinase